MQVPGSGGLVRGGEAALLRQVAHGLVAVFLLQGGQAGQRLAFQDDARQPGCCAGRGEDITPQVRPSTC